MSSDFLFFVFCFCFVLLCFVFVLFFVCLFVCLFVFWNRKRNKKSKRFKSFKVEICGFYVEVLVGLFVVCFCFANNVLILYIMMYDANQFKIPWWWDMSLHNSFKISKRWSQRLWDSSSIILGSYFSLHCRKRGLTVNAWHQS